VVVEATVQRWKLEPATQNKKKRAIRLRRGQSFTFNAFPTTDRGLAVLLEDDCEVADFADVRLVGQSDKTFEDLRIDSVDKRKVVLTAKVKDDAALIDLCPIQIAMAKRDGYERDAGEYFSLI